MNMVMLVLEFDGELEDPAATVTELARRVRGWELTEGLQSTRAKPVKVVGYVLDPGESGVTMGQLTQAARSTARE